MTQALIDRIEAAESKAALTALAKEAGFPKPNQKKGVETIRAELLEAAETVPVESDSDAPAPDADASELRVPEAPTAPEPEPPVATAPSHQNRLIKNEKTGAVFVWTPALAKRKGMKEV